MRVIVVGAAGDIGKAVCAELGGRHDLIRAGRKGADVQVDMADLTSVDSMYARVGPVDAVVVCAGSAQFLPLADFLPDDFALGLNSKVMGQVNLVLVGQRVLRERGSFTLIGGIIGREQIRLGASAAAANGAVESFVRAAAVELERGLRINAVSPGMLASSTERYGEFFPGYEPVPAAQVGRAYAKSVDGVMTGQVFELG